MAVPVQLPDKAATDTGTRESGARGNKVLCAHRACAPPRNFVHVAATMSKDGGPLKGTLYASLATSNDTNKLTLRCSQKARAIAWTMSPSGELVALGGACH